MKKLLSIALIVAMLACTFASCNDAATNTDDSKESTQSSTEKNDLNTVTAEEWAAAFDLSTLSSFTLEISEIDNTGEYSNKETVMAYDGYLYTVNGDDIDLCKVSTYSFSDLNAMWLSELNSELKRMENYGYNNFTYSDSTDLYTAKIEVDIPDCAVTVKFDNKRISNITIDIYGQMPTDTNVYDIDCSYSFSEYNSTTAPENAKYLVTSDQWAAAFELSSLSYYKYTSTHIYGKYTDVISVEYDSSSDEYTVITNGDASTRTGTPEGFREMGSYGFYISEFISENDELSYGFYKFTYGNSKYTANMEIDGSNVQIEVSFLNGKITTITVNGDDFSQTLTISYEK